MKRVLLVDVDSKIPNLALMKLAHFEKGRGNHVSLKRLDISYYPTLDKGIVQIVDAEGFDLVYVSSIFPGSLGKYKIINAPSIISGGTGIDLSIKLQDEVEALLPDYSIYPEADTSIGFLSRGCIRHCSFCFVPKKEGALYRTAFSLDDIIQHKKVQFLDNNFLALPEHKEILQDLLTRFPTTRVDFNQGLDFRLVTKENLKLLSELKYSRNYIFAFDSIKYKTEMEKYFPIMQKYLNQPWLMKMYTYCHPSMDISRDIMRRIYWCRERQVLPYIMRDISCFYDENSQVYVDLAAWCNQPSVFRKMDFSEFLEKRHGKNGERIRNSLKMTGEL